MEVGSVSRLSGPALVFNLSVEAPHTYFTGSEQVLSHNKVADWLLKVVRNHHDEGIATLHDLQQPGKGGKWTLRDMKAYHDALQHAEYELLKSQGRNVKKNAYVRTPFGGRYIDIVEFDEADRIIRGWEFKTGEGKQPPKQRRKDEWIQSGDRKAPYNDEERFPKQFPIDVVRYPGLR